ncbi:phosphate regulon sensor histidine kinase PhoR [Pseudidiomarina andamanensis]|uniref:histidine kinase n=1 Tax=Pseudidiomarina andamanensis TaxID=1940690 RepID=A0AA92ILR8_9GAMM|nr:phosphate regulon sensor histidine kinase PhoR [Pseudidiomarina andamanensis]MDS0219598.1 phosphate regulon sensor histidine kinase PhoR [Pseudidiomarina andamanensis]QGT95775.1 two-component system sensor histidine kinase PhoR [Pseudidiomarina andamanensis]
MDRRYSVIFILKGLLWFIVPVGFFGWLLGYFWATLALSLITLVVWHYYYQYKLVDWLWHRRTMLPPSAPGSWSYIYDGIYRTQRRSQQRRRALARLLRRFREASEAIPDAAIVFRKDGGLIWCNKLGQFYFGLKWPADTGIRLSNLIRHPEFIAYLQKGDFSEDIHLASPVREDVELEIRIMPYSEDQYLLMARDVTQLKQLEQMRKDFVANVSHELKTPLTVLQGYLEMLDEPASMPPAMLTKAVTDMQAQSERMRNLVDQLLSLSRMDVHRTDMFDRTVNVPNILDVIQNDAERLNQEKQHTLTFDIADIHIHGIEDELRSVFSNLITNAIHYTQPHGTIKVTWKMVGQDAEFSVEDNGPGIPAEHVGRLTERFYRVDKDRNSKKGGSGLGLAIVQQALEHHHSRLLIDSVVGRGSKFYFRISEELVIKK